MDIVVGVIDWVRTNNGDLALLVTSLIGTASIVVRLTPTLKDDNALKGIIKFVGKFVALNRK
jgi:hypothetical protein